MCKLNDQDCSDRTAITRVTREIIEGRFYNLKRDFEFNKLMLNTNEGRAFFKRLFLSMKGLLKMHATLTKTNQILVAWLAYSEGDQPNLDKMYRYNYQTNIRSDTFCTF